LKPQRPTLTREQVFALKAWTLKVKAGKYYAHPTYNPEKEIGPFKSLQATTAAISRKLAEEYTSRTQRLEKFDAKHRKNSGTQRRVSQRREAAAGANNAHKRRA
jgi:hypothetical protein